MLRDDDAAQMHVGVGTVAKRRHLEGFHELKSEFFGVFAIMPQIVGVLRIRQRVQLGVRLRRQNGPDNGNRIAVRTPNAATTA